MPLKKSPKCDLRGKYNRHLEISFIFALAILIAAFKFMPSKSAPKKITEVPQDIIIAVTPQTHQKIEIPPKPQSPSLYIEAPDDAEDLPEIEVPAIDDYVPPLVVPKVIEKDNEYVAPDFKPFAEVMPSPVGGSAALYNRLKYPDLAIKAGIKGTVLIQAYIDEDGKVVRAEVIKGIGAGCDEEALKAVKETVFNPGRQMDRPVKVQLKIPIKFVLK